MQKLEVFGINKLKGQIDISGSKNASLPVLAATLLSDKKIYLRNLPKVKDIETMINLLRSLGSKVKFENQISSLDLSKINNLVKIKSGDLYIGSKIEKTRKSIEKRINALGFPFAKVSSKKINVNTISFGGVQGGENETLRKKYSNQSLNKSKEFDSEIIEKREAEIYLKLHKEVQI